MALLLSNLTRSLQRMTPGERRLTHALKKHLEDDYLVWYNVPIGRKHLRPDFVILHPKRGIIVLEVKDWKLNTIRQVTPDTFTLLTPDGEKEADNPLEQARNYLLEIVHLLQRDRFLVQPDGHYKGKLAFPYSYGVVFTKISRAEFASQPELARVLPSHWVICKDEMTLDVDSGKFQEQLWRFCTYDFGEPLSDAQIDHIRWHLFPEIVLPLRPIDWLAQAEDSDEEQLEPNIPDIIQVIDRYQEQLARNIGEGHRIIHGVAGSGKTLILVYRCIQLAQEATKPILVLCFNVSLAAKLRQMLHVQGIADRVVVRHFHGWCNDLLQAHQIAKPSWNQTGAEGYVESLVQKVIQSVEAGKIPAGIYGAVMIDEGHDFQPEWLKLLVQMVDPQTRSLLLLYDDAQNLIRAEKRKQFSFKSVGIQAQGRTTILKINYRNTVEVLNLAYEFSKEMMTPIAPTEEDVPVLVEPLSAGRHGSRPQLLRLSSFNQEIDCLMQQVQQLNDRGTAWNEMAIVYRSRFMGEKIAQHFKQAQIPLEWINENTNSRNFKPDADSIKLVTMHSSKGLEFPVVLIPGLGYLPTPEVPIEEESRLLYVAMTRVIDRLVLTCDRPSEFVKRLEVALSRVA